MFPEPDRIGKHFHELFKVLPDQQKKKIEWKKNKKGKVTKNKEKRKPKVDGGGGVGGEVCQAPDVELATNASAFAVFASVRLAVLERWMKDACDIHLASSSACSASASSPLDAGADSDADDNSERAAPRVPKIVGVGLRSVFELVRESRTSNPEFCTKALRALLDILQGQQPEGLKGEPAQVTEPLFELLLDLATSQTGAERAEDGQLTGVACACLLSLVAAYGDTGHLLRAVAALLMCPRPLAQQNITMPTVLASLQRSVHGVLLGKTIRPDWMTCGTPKSCLLMNYRVKIPIDEGAGFRNKALASDGKFLYLHNSHGLFKIGSGYGGSIKGHVYLHRPEFYPDKKGWLGYSQGILYYRCLGLSDLIAIETEELTVKSVTKIDKSCDGVMFSDGESLGVITSAKDDGFVVRSLSATGGGGGGELPLKLARKCVDACGGAAFDEEHGLHTLHSGADDEVAALHAGKEFSLIRTTHGKVLLCGKWSSLGMKSGGGSGSGGGGGGRMARWAELSVPKSPCITEVAVGHDGAHAILLADDGTVYFTGTARRGEDGDQNKVRRQPKAVKPKKISKLDGQVIVNAACNNGTTALVTKDGELIMYGKDTTHCDPSTGVVTDLKDIHVSQVSLGKAHAVVVSNKGHLYTFGINNKGQCGRDFTTQIKEASVVAMETGVAGDEEGGGEGEEEADWEGGEGVMCAPGTHRWKHELCMVCTVCRECTGYSISCLSSMRSDRNPGQECGCGEGDSGCAECGCCRICGRENVDNSELAILGPSGAGDIAGMMRLDLIFGGRQGARIQDHLQRRLDERKQRQRGKLIVGAKATPSSSSSSMHQTPHKSHPHPRTTPSLQPSSSNTEDIAGGSDVEREATRVSSLPPARVYLPTESPVIQIASGLHHTIVLTQSGEVFAFGSNSHGQLGVGDVMARAGPVQVRLASPAIQVAAGSNHSVVLFARGDVCTFGSHQKNQLGRNQSKEAGNSKEWFSFPGPIPQVGPRHGRRATWVGASADQTFLKLDESLINSISLKHSTLMANKHCIVLLPTECLESKSFKCLVINKRDGNCNNFSGPLQVDFTHAATCLDPYYDVLWSFVETEDGLGGEVACYNVICSEVKSGGGDMPLILRPELAVPNMAGVHVRRSHAARHMLAALDTLVARATAGAHHVPPATCQLVAVPLAVPPAKAAAYSSDDFSSVTRFESHGGGWGYSGHSIEAIRFMADTDIMLGGFGLFGGRGEYTGKIKLFDIGMEGGEQESDGEMLAETDEAPYECGPRQKYPMLFEEPVLLQANKWYVAWARVSGPSSDCGSGGQGMVTTEDQVVFYFKSSKKSNNGTDVNAGQIPQLLYRVVAAEQGGPGSGGVGGRGGAGGVEQVHALSRDFSRHVTRHCFQSLIALLQWAWAAYRSALADIGHHSVGMSLQMAQMELESLVYICRASLRLLRTYVNEIYPGQVNAVQARLSETSQLAESIGDVRALLRQILLDPVPTVPFRHAKQKKTQSAQLALYTKMTKEILDECHETFVASFHAFYPTAFLKWTCLCNLLASMDKEGENAGSSDRLASAVVAALCSRSIRLRSTFPILTTPASDEPTPPKADASTSNAHALPIMPCLDSHCYPLLVEHMTYRSQSEADSSSSGAGAGAVVWQFREVVDRLLDVVSLSVRQALCLEKSSHSAQLVHNCCHLLVRVIAELASQASGIDEELEGGCGGRVMQATPSRFSRTNGCRTWNTGNGSPDAVCFSVDRPGVAIAGAAVYGGAGSYDYELELLDDANTPNNPGNDPSHAQRWNSLQLTRGVFGVEDCLSDDIVELKFDYPVFIKENVKYAIRLRNHGGRTSNGDGGLSSVRGPDGVTFSFSTCSLSFNGTTQTRGQIPYLLYYSNPVGEGGEGGCRNKAVLEVGFRKMALQMAAAVMGRCARLLELARQVGAEGEASATAHLLSSATLVTTLLPLTLAHISSLATSDPKSGVQVLGLIQDLLPHVAALNLLSGGGGGGSSGGGNMARSSSTVDSNCQDMSRPTTSHYYAQVESDHPYKPASVSNYRVVFPDNVRWMAVEFAPECGTAQAEDSLQLYIPASVAFPAAAAADDHLPYWPVLHRFSNQWPQSAIVLPGNEAMFSLETASDYVKDEKACQFGFRCQVIGYEWPVDAHDGLRLLEMELAFLGGMCAASLIKKDLVLPVSSDEFEEDMENVEEIARQIFAKHSSLLSKGFALASPPTVTQALDAILPFSWHSNERLFLRDLVAGTSGTPGGRLCRWLQPESHVEPQRCQLQVSRDQPLRCAHPATLTLITRDQYGDRVHTPDLKIEVKAVPIDKSEVKSRRVSQPDEMSLGGHALPSLDTPYEVTVKDKMCYKAISIMKAYENYSFEELRYTSPAMKRSSEKMLVRANGDGSYSVTWTPASVGWYSLLTTIDGYSMDEGCKVEVKEPPQGVLPVVGGGGGGGSGGGGGGRRGAAGGSAGTQPASRLRRFCAKNSAGLRVRAHPSLQSEMIGTVHVNGTIAFIDEIHNDDGVWLRLNAESTRQYCSGGGGGGGSGGGSHAEAWCLQYNQHLSRTLLLPLQEPRSLLDHVISNTALRKTETLKPSAHVYKVVNCGASSHNVRSKPSLKAPSIGMLFMGNTISVIDHLVNNEGTWVQLDRETMNKFCVSWEGEAWSLASDKTPHTYLQPEPDVQAESSRPPQRSESPAKKGFDFSSAPGSPVPLPTSTSSSNTNPFVFGSTSHAAGERSSTPVNKWLKPEEKRIALNRDVPPELMGVSVKELVRAIGESRANGNGVTPPDSPRRASPRSSSPVPIPGVGVGSMRNRALGDSHSSSPPPATSPRSIPLSPLVSGSTQSDTSAHVSSLTRDPSPSPPSSCSSKQAGTQTSPDRHFGSTATTTTTTTTATNFSIGSGSTAATNTTGGGGGLSPKAGRKPRSKRQASPPSAAQTAPLPSRAHQPPAPTHAPREPVKEAMRPSVAESVRATFAALLWHEGVVHDAMACAAFLKFHPALPKHGALVVTRHIHRQKVANQRHSVEVSTLGSIQPSTLEALTRSAANANANRQRHAKAKQKEPIRESDEAKQKQPIRESDETKQKQPIRESDEEAASSSAPSTVNALPSALRALVLLWEQVAASCLQTFAANSVLPSPAEAVVIKGAEGGAAGGGKQRGSSSRKKKAAAAEWRAGVGGANGANVRECVCELCGGVFAHPITYHMRSAHPGCGAHAGSHGYNSAGNYCVGWAGNCGDGGQDGSSWYLLCQTCRHQCLLRHEANPNRTSAKRRQLGSQRKAHDPTNKATSPTSNTGGMVETHIVMKNNAMFLLELSGGGERSSDESPPQNSPFPLPPFQCLQALNAHPIQEDPFPSPPFLPSRTSLDNGSDLEKSRPFHRSVSMGPNGAAWGQHEARPTPLGQPRKRLNSTCQVVPEGGDVSLLCHPSAGLERLSECAVDVLSRPTLLFLLQQHNLRALHLAMRHALRKATCRTYAIQALNWLLRSVTQTTCLHDLLWWLVAALTPSKDDPEGVCEHPVSDMGLAGEAVRPLPSAFHSLLQTVADLMLLLPPSSALLQMAVRCFGVHFTPNDHTFLHRSHVFSNISKILSRAEEEQEDASISMHESQHLALSQVEALRDVTGVLETKASSRQAMVGSLVDNSTETFWESGDEDRNKTKVLTLTCPSHASPAIIYVHIDNCRDLANKVSSVTFLSGSNSEELVRLRTLEVECRASGWINCSIKLPRQSVLRLELKGPDNSLRVRQVRVLAAGERTPQSTAIAIQQRNTEAETLKVFRLITSQVFGKLIESGGRVDRNSVVLAGDEDAGESNDLKEHVVGILFARSKLTHLQRQVCAHIVEAIRRETALLREEWETRLCSGGPSPGAGVGPGADSVDTYCFEMLSMVLALSGSAVGRAHLASQHALLNDLLCLLHTGSARVQRQVTGLLRRMLPSVPPAVLARLTGVPRLPPTDFTVVASAKDSDGDHFDCYQAGILDVLLSCVAKALTVQVKVKAKGVSSVTLATAIHPRDHYGTRWFLRGSVSRRLAEDIIHLVKDMAAGKVSEEWAQVTKAAIAEAVVGVQRLGAEWRVPGECLRCPTLWLALAALCVLDKDHVERLSSARWGSAPLDPSNPPPPRPTCSNHDDGETNAIIQCDVCGNLCTDCDRFLHLHRRTRTHHRQVCKEEEDAIKVDLHEGCGRTKLFWALLLADSCTLKALVELRRTEAGGARAQAAPLTGVCRFCGTTSNSGLLAIGNVCADHECQEHGRNVCTKMLDCNHPCSGIRGETECLPCLHNCSRDARLKQDADDMCMICFTEALCCAPAIQLHCGHVFHLHCCRNVLLNKWAGPRITFSFSQCPICKAPMDHPVLSSLLSPIRQLWEDVRRKAVMRLEYEGLDQVGRPDPAAYAMDRYAYYVCFKCGKAYYGGEARCDVEAGGNGDFDPAELVCGACSDVARAQMCPKHGTDFLEYKCRYCCSVAVFFCFGTTHFCNACHDDFQRVTNIPTAQLPRCPAGPKAKSLDGEECPLHVKHPPTGEEFALGCGVCRNAHTF